MQYLLDTHVVLWWLLEPEKIGKKARNVIQDREQEIFVSSASFWEMAIKSGLARLTLPSNIIEHLKNDSIELMPVTAEDALAVADLPALHNDPFDRMLVVQAKSRDMVLITHDKFVMKYPVTTLKV